MEENVKAFREAQDQSKNNRVQEEVENEQPVTDVMQSATFDTDEVVNDKITERLDSIPDAMEEEIQDPLRGEGLTDSMVDDDQSAFEESKSKSQGTQKTPLIKLLAVTKKLRMRFAEDAFVDDDPAALGYVFREIRELATAQTDEPFLDLLYRFREELLKLHKRAKKSVSDSELTAPEIFKVEKVLSKVITVHETLTESDLPFILEDVGNVDEGEGDLTNIEDMDESIIDPADQEQLLDEDIYLVEIEEEEADDYTRWTEPVLELIAVRKARKLN